MTTLQPITETPDPHSAFEGRVAVVTGASSGIGAAIARRLVAGGAKVAGLARRADRIEALGPDVLAIATDVTDPDAVQAAVERVVAEFGPPDLLVANAGVMLPSPVEEARRDDWDRMISLNIGGVSALVAAGVGHLRASAADGRPADLVIVSSIADVLAFPGYAMYGATKAAVSTFTRNLRLELAPFGVRTTNVRPGFTATELADHVTHDDKRAELHTLLELVPPISPDDVAQVVVNALALPPQVCVSDVTVLPTVQPVSV